MPYVRTPPRFAVRALPLLHRQEGVAAARRLPDWPLAGVRGGEISDLKSNAKNRPHPLPLSQRERGASCDHPGPLPEGAGREDAVPSSLRTVIPICTASATMRLAKASVR